MNLRQALALAIQTVRKSRHLTQEDFGVISSRTYVSALERGLKSPTVDKLDEIAKVMSIHPSTLILLAYAILESDGHGSASANTLDFVVLETKTLLSQLNDAITESSKPR